MEDPGWAWPYWKFGLKRTDLFSTLQDRYNTFPSSIQDPEAFHHDVCEIAHEASSPDEFHRLMADRKQHRLRELNDSLESASVEIIANPSLIGTAQWQYALQLFRTKSLDSLVRYFASYLPDDHPWHRGGSSSTGSPFSADESLSPSFFDNDHDDGQKPLLTHEPFSISTSIKSQHLPPSPRSMTMQSDSSAASPTDLVHHDYVLHNLTPARTLSFSECESDHFGLADSHHAHDDELSHGDPETPTTSVSDLSETRSLGEADDKEIVISAAVSEASITFLSSRLPSDAADSMESETPTPKPETAAAESGSTSLLRREAIATSPTSPKLLTVAASPLVRVADGVATLSPTAAASSSSTQGTGIAPATEKRCQRVLLDPATQSWWPCVEGTQA